MSAQIESMPLMIEKSREFQISEAMRSKNKLRAARAYLEAGLSLLLVHGIGHNQRCTCGKRNCPHPGKHPIAEFFPHGANSATTSAKKIKAALRRYPNANLAVSLEGLTVADADGPAGKALLKESDLPPTVRVKTSRGYHLYFLGETKSFKAPELDILSGKNRYTLLPPSVHVSGHNYEWSKIENSAANLPASPLFRKQKPKQRSRAASFSEGERNNQLYKIACALRVRSISDEAVFNIVSAANRECCRPPLDETEVLRIVESSGKQREDADELFGRAPKTPLPMEWLWYPYIPRHGVTILAGNPGCGKSLLTAKLISIVTAGMQWPLSKERPSGNRVLLLSAEDNWSRVTLHRLQRAGAVIENISIMKKFRVLSPECLIALSQYVKDWQPALVVVDTVSAYFGSDRDMNRQNEVAEFLTTLNEIAEDSGCAILCIAHLNKQTNEDPLFRIVGSIGFAASVRCALFLGHDPADRSRLALAHGKKNLSEEAATLIFEKKGGGRDDVPVLNCVGTSSATRHDVCQPEKRENGRPEAEGKAAEEFILNLLTEKPMRWSQLESQAEARGIASSATLANVRARLARAKKIIQVGKGPKAKWKIGHDRVENESI